MSIERREVLVCDACHTDIASIDLDLAIDERHTERPGIVGNYHYDHVCLKCRIDFQKEGKRVKEA